MSASNRGGRMERRILDFRGDRDDDHLQHAGQRDAPGERHRGPALLDISDTDQRNKNDDEHDIEEARRKGSHGKTPQRVQHARIEGDQRHAEEEGERNARKQDGELQLRRVGGKAWGEQKHQPGHDELANKREHYEG
jgi:hypothetical protein